METLREWHAQRAASFISVNGAEVVRSYGDLRAEYTFLTESAALLDLSHRGRLCLLGQDRVKFLHGQVTNDVNRLAVGEGCYAALVNPKARMESDLWVYRLEDELLLDFEPGLTDKISNRLERFIIADDVQIVDVAPHYGLLTVQGPKALEAARAFSPEPPEKPGLIRKWSSTYGDVYVAHRSRLGSMGCDFFIPIEHIHMAIGALRASVERLGGGLAGWECFEAVRIEQGIPRFGLDMDETNLPPEAGLEKTAISYTKGCYIGQEIIARLRTYGQVAKRLRQLRIQTSPENVSRLSKGTRLLFNSKDIGYLTSVTYSPRQGCAVALGYVRREVSQEAVLQIAGTSGLEATLLA